MQEGEERVRVVVRAQRLIVTLQERPGETLNGYIEAARTGVPIEQYFGALPPEKKEPEPARSTKAGIKVGDLIVVDSYHDARDKQGRIVMFDWEGPVRVVGVDDGFVTVETPLGAKKPFKQYTVNEDYFRVMGYGAAYQGGKTLELYFSFRKQPSDTLIAAFELRPRGSEKNPYSYEAPGDLVERKGLDKLWGFLRLSGYCQDSAPWFQNSNSRYLRC